MTTPLNDSSCTDNCKVDSQTKPEEPVNINFDLVIANLTEEEKLLTADLRALCNTRVEALGKCVQKIDSVFSPSIDELKRRVDNLKKSRAELNKFADVCTGPCTPCETASATTQEEVKTESN